MPGRRRGTDGYMTEDHPSPQLREHLAALFRRKWTVIGVTLAVVAAAFAFSGGEKVPAFRSSAEVLVRPLTDSDAPNGFLNMETERRLAVSARVREIARQRAKAKSLGAVSVTTRPNANTIVFASVSADAAVARRTAQTYAEAYLQFRRQQVLDDLVASSEPLTKRIQELDRQVVPAQQRIFRTTDPSQRALYQIRLNSLLAQKTFLEQRLSELILPQNLRVGSILQPAASSRLVTGSDRQRTVILAVFLGLVLGAAVALVRERLDDRVRSARELETLFGVPVLAVLPRLRARMRRDEDLLVVTSRPDSDLSEAIRTLRAAVLFAAAESGAKALVVTSPQPGEGKTTVVANLGVALANAGKRVIMVSADLRQPRLARVFGRTDGVGMTDVVSGQTRILGALERLGIENLRLLPTGSLPRGDALLSSDAMRTLVQTLKAAADFVILDAPPVLPVADALALAQLADGVLFVVDEGRARPGSIEEAKRRLDQVGARVMGAVLNNHDGAMHRYDYYGYYRAERDEEESRRAEGRAPLENRSAQVWPRDKPAAGDWPRETDGTVAYGAGDAATARDGGDVRISLVGDGKPAGGTGAGDGERAQNAVARDGGPAQGSVVRDGGEHGRWPS